VSIPETIPIVGASWDDVLFVLFAVGMIGSALLVVTLRDIIRSGVAMIASFAALAGLYVLLGSPIMAATQVLVYIGAISILVLFAIMLTQTKAGPARLVFQTQWWAAAIAAVAIVVVLAAVVVSTDWGAEPVRLESATSDVARMLFEDYTLPFEAVSVLLLAAIVGGVFLAKKDDTRDEEGR
jgi:NADH:ubiquinone oxidoreductase subunit 6 (subunit J)